jgi:hypothetical protein
MTYTVGKANDGVFLAAIEKLIASFGAMGTSEADILGPSRVWVTFDNIPASRGGNVGE